MLFVVIAIDKPDCLPLRMATREAHFQYGQQTGVIKLGGPFLDGGGKMAGSLLVIEADDLEGARTWHAGDPYVKVGLFAHSEVRPWRPSINRIGAQFRNEKP